MILAPTTRRVIRPFDKPSFVHTQRYGLIRGHWANEGRTGLWLFNEGSGNTIADLSGNGIGELTFASGGPQTWTSGKFGSALDFPGNLQRRVVCTNVPPIGPRLTVIVWFKINTYVNNAGLVDAGFSTDFLFRFSSNKLQFYIVGANILSNKADFNTDLGWHQGVGVYDGVKKYIYIDGVYDNSSNETDVLGGTTTYDIGAYGNSTEFLGLIDHVFTYNRALSPSEIAELYAKPFLGIERRTRISYFFIPTVGGVVYSASGTIAVSLEVSGVAKVDYGVGGVIIASIDVSGAAGLNIASEGVVAIESVMEGKIGVVKAVEGTVAMEFSLEASVIRIQPVAGVIEATSIFAGTAITAIEAGGVVTTVSTFVGTAKVDRNAIGSMAVDLNLEGTAGVNVAVEGTVSSVFELEGSIARNQAVSSLLSLLVTFEGTASVSKVYSVSGTLAMLAVLTGSASIGLVVLETLTLNSRLKKTETESSVLQKTLNLNSKLGS